MLDLPNLYPNAQQVMTMSKRYSELSPELIEESLRLIDEGKTDTEISNIIGLSTYYLRRIRDKNNLPRSRQWANTHTIEQMNDVIDMIREGSTLAEISSQTGISNRKIKQWREEKIREGNPLPEFKKGVARRQKYSDEELIELAFLNPGYGFKRFINYLSVKDYFVHQLFTEFKEFTNGEEDLLQVLQDPSYVSLVTREEYRQITGRKYSPPGSGLSTSRNPGAARGSNAKSIPLPPQEFNWGPYSPREY